MSGDVIGRDLGCCQILTHVHVFNNYIMAATRSHESLLIMDPNLWIQTCWIDVYIARCSVKVYYLVDSIRDMHGFTDRGNPAITAVFTAVTGNGSPLLPR